MICVVVGMCEKAVWWGQTSPCNECNERTKHNRHQKVKTYCTKFALACGWATSAYPQFFCGKTFEIEDRSQTRILGQFSVMRLRAAAAFKNLAAG
jgi:hypothetical protein